MKLAHTLVAAAALSTLAATTAFGGTWKTGAEQNQDKWWYDNGDGSFPTGWQWIDGDQDGVAESYYFDLEGWLLTNTTTPDGYEVNSDGKWTVNGEIQTQTVKSQSLAALSEEDFIVSGDNSVVKSTSDHSVITRWREAGYPDSVMVNYSFSTGDSVTTARGITLGDDKADVIAAYGEAAAQPFDGNADEWYQFISSEADRANIAGAASVVEYSADPYKLRFYFDQDEVLIGIIYCRASLGADSSAVLNTGTYQFYQWYLYEYRIGDSSETARMKFTGSVYDGSDQSYQQIVSELADFGLISKVSPLSITVTDVSENAITVECQDIIDDSERKWTDWDKYRVIETYIDGNPGEQRTIEGSDGSWNDFDAGWCISASEDPNVLYVQQWGGSNDEEHVFIQYFVYVR